MLFDTDVLIFVQRGNGKAIAWIEKSDSRFVSVQTYMELLQGASSKSQHTVVRGFLLEFGFRILPFTENIGHRASIYIEEYALKTGIRAGDAIIAATAVENNMPLSSANAKHFREISDLQLNVFRP